MIFRRDTSHFKPFAVILAGIFLSLSVNLPQAFAYGDSYSSDFYGDSYAQAWKDYKYQNQFQTSNYQQETWWQKTTNWLNSFFNKPAATPTVTAPREAFDQRYEPEQKFQILETQTKAPLPGVQAITESAPAKFTLPSKLSDCKDEVSRKLFLENSPDYEMVKIYQQTNGDGSVCDVYQYQSKTEPTPWGETVYIQPEQAGKLAQDRAQLNVADQPSKLEETKAQEQKTYPEPSEPVSRIIPMEQSAKQEVFLQAAPQGEEFQAASQDAYKFYPVFKPDEAVTNEVIAARISEDFKSHKDFQAGFDRHVEGAVDAGKRLGEAAVSEVAGDATGRVAAAAQLGKAVSEAVGFAAQETVGNLMEKNQVKLLDNDRVVFRNICDKMNQELSLASINSYSFEYNVITAKEAAQRNNEWTVAGAVAGVVPVVGQIVGLVRHQPFEVGQVEYRLSLDYQKYDVLSQYWRVDLDYRVDDYTVSSGSKARGVIEAQYKPYYYNINSLDYELSREAEYAPE